MPQVLVDKAQVLAVSSKADKKDKAKRYYTAHLFQHGDYPRYYAVSIRSEEVKSFQDIVGKLTDVVLIEFRRNGFTNYGFKGFLSEVVSASNG